MSRESRSSVAYTWNWRSPFIGYTHSGTSWLTTVYAYGGAEAS